MENPYHYQNDAGAQYAQYGDDPAAARSHYLRMTAGHVPMAGGNYNDRVSAKNRYGGLQAMAMQTPVQGYLNRADSLTQQGLTAQRQAMGYQQGLTNMAAADKRDDDLRSQVAKQSHESAMMDKLHGIFGAPPGGQQPGQQPGAQQPGQLSGQQPASQFYEQAPGFVGPPSNLNIASAESPLEVMQRQNRQRMQQAIQNQREIPGFRQGLHNFVNGFNPFEDNVTLNPFEAISSLGIKYFGQ